MKTGYEHIKTYDELVTFQRMMTREYPYYPLEMKDWKKVSSQRITVEGLKQIPILKSKIIMGKNTKYDIDNYITLLKLYAESNPTKERLSNYQKENSLYFYSGNMAVNISENGKLRPELDLKALGYTEDNPLYDDKLSISMAMWGHKLILECYRIGKLEGKI